MQRLNVVSKVDGSVKSRTETDDALTSSIGANFSSKHYLPSWLLGNPFADLNLALGINLFQRTVEEDLVKTLIACHKG